MGELIVSGAGTLGTASLLWEGIAVIMEVFGVWCVVDAWLR